MPPSEEQIKAFREELSERISEAEFFTAAAESNMKPQQMLPIVRRLRYLEEKARALELEYLAEPLAKLVEALYNETCQAYNLKQHLGLFFDLLAFCLHMEMERFHENASVPQEFEKFATDSAAQICSNILHDQCTSEKSLRILIADDEQIIRSFLEELFRDEGYMVYSVSDGREAITALDSNFFDLMFSDINMPYSSGLDVLKHARQLSLETEIVIVTGYASVENASRSLRYGAYDYITKPFKSPNELLATIDRAKRHIFLKRRNRWLMRDLQAKNTQLRNYAEGLEEALQRLEEKNRALIHADRMATLGVLVAGLAHEINNPTTFIRGNLQTLDRFWGIIAECLNSHMDKLPSNDKLKFIMSETPVLLHDMIVGTDRISRITNGLRSFARAEEGENMEKCNPGVCIDHSLSLVDNRLRDKVDLRLDLSELPQVTCSEQQITQVLINLLVNAADAALETPEPAIMVKSHCNSEGVFIQVLDNGPGVPQDVAAKMFDPFFTTKPVDRGTGLGLSISLGIANNHGGSLSYSPAGKPWTTMFELFLPLDLCKARKSRKLPRLLLADSGTSSLRAVASSLRAAGNFSISLAKSGEEVLSLTKKHPPDILILDTDLLDMDGFEVLKKLRDSGVDTEKDVRVIVVTSINDLAAAERFFSLGARKLLHKPCKVRDIVDSLPELLSGGEH